MRRKPLRRGCPRLLTALEQDATEAGACNWGMRGPEKGEEERRQRGPARLRADVVAGGSRSLLIIHPHARWSRKPHLFAAGVWREVGGRQPFELVQADARNEQLQLYADCGPQAMAHLLSSIHPHELLVVQLGLAIPAVRTQAPVLRHAVVNAGNVRSQPGRTRDAASEAMQDSAGDAAWPPR